jgi:ATPase subunit of ABC transporter with duplicated ATPase domains
MKEANRKKEEKIKELQAFIQRFSANASKSKQATSRKKMLEKIELDEIVPSSRKYPFIEFKPTRESGKEILSVINLSKELDGKKVLNNVSFQLLKGDKVAILGSNSIVKTLLLDILAGDEKYDKGKIEWGTTITTSYFKQDNRDIFTGDDTLVKWMGKYYNGDDETELRGFLGRMLFSGEDVFKKVSVLSGGEKARCLLSKMMLEANNFLIFDEPTNHLDLESITALNNGLIKYNGEMIFTSKDHQFVETVANRIIDIQDDGTIIDRRCTYDEYLESKKKDKK